MEHTCIAHQWLAEPFHEYVNDMVEAERTNLGPLKLSDDEIRKSYLLVWLGFAQPAGNA